MKIFTSQERTVVIILASLFMLGVAVKTTKDHFNSGTDQITLIGSNADVVDFYAGLNEQNIESAGKVDINTAEKIINKRNELRAFSLLEDLMLVHGIGQKTFEKLLPYIQIQ
jgi:hypothetical protein